MARQARIGSGVVLALLFASTVAAQSVRGEVFDKSSAAPLPGVVVVLLDSLGKEVARSLTSESGDFRVLAPGPGRYRVRTLRIGFRPVTSETFPLVAGTEVTKRLEVASVPVTLDTVRVAGKNACRGIPDSVSSTFRVWEQVRAALTAAQLTARARAIGATIVTYQRTLDPLRGRILGQQVRAQSGLSSGAWIALAADRLHRDGYVTEDDDGSMTYYAPDLTVLLSDGFIEDHCLRVARESNATRIGIAFEPTRDRRDVPEIQGTLWVERKSSELQRLEFQYVNLESEVQSGRPGGEMDFARMRNGAWVISRWNIRMPVIERRRRQSTGLGTSGAMNEAYVAAIRVEGGELSLVTRGQDTLWSRPPLPLMGTLVDSATSRPLVGARVALRGANASAVSDSTGRFRMTNVLPGEYTLDIQSRTAGAGVTYSIPLVFADTLRPVSIQVPRPEQIAAALCGSKKGGIVTGTVVSAGDSIPRAGIKVVARWTDIVVNGPVSVGTRQMQLDARTDARGIYRLCGVPTDTKLELRAETATDVSASVTIRIPPDQKLGSADLTLGGSAP